MKTPRKNITPKPKKCYVAVNPDRMILPWTAKSLRSSVREDMGWVEDEKWKAAQKGGWEIMEGVITVKPPAN